MSDLPQKRPSHSPVTRPGYGRGRKPGNYGKRWPSEVLEPSEVVGLINACSTVSNTGKRNRALIAVMYRTGIKVSELLALQADDYNSGDETLRIKGKGAKGRIIGLDRETCSLLGYWTDARRELGLTGGPLFSTLHGTELSGAYVRTLLPRLAEAVGIGKRVHPNAFRLTHARELVEEGTPLNVIQKVLGLATLGATEAYLSKELNLPPTNPVKLLQDRPWTARLNGAGSG
jgi:site-specific recombinase XerD